MISVSFGKGKKGAPSDPVELEDLHDFAAEIREKATVNPFPSDIDKDQYKLKKDRGPWVMRAIDEATAYDAETGGWHRRLGSVTLCDWLMFDADKMPAMSYAKTRRALRALGVGFIMYRSTGDGMDCKGGDEAFRVLIPCDSVAAELIPAVSAHFRENVLAPATDGGEWDPACDQPTRVIYLPFKGAPVDEFEGDLFDAAAYFEENELTIVKRGREGMERGEADPRSFADFIDWCLDNVEDAILIQKPDGRVALQMPGQQPDKYSSGPDGGDGWNFYLPSGSYEMLVFHSLHELTEPAGSFKVQDAVNVLAREYGREPARLYAAGMREAMASSSDSGKPRSDVLSAVEAARDAIFETRRNINTDNLPECGAPPTGSEDFSPQTFSNHQPIKWPEDIGWNPPERPEDPGEDADDDRVLRYQEQLQDYNEQIVQWEREYQENMIERFQWFNNSFVLVANKARVANLNQHPSATPLKLSDWQVQQMPKFYMVGEGDKAKMKSFADSWLRSPQRQEVFDVSYAPGEGRVFTRDGDTLLNRFHIEPFEYTEETDLLARFEWLVARTHPIKREAELFLDWLAFTFRYPHERVLWAYVNISEARGSGRGTLKRVMENLLGVHNVKATDVNMVDKDQYHDWAHECRITVIEEADEKSGGGRVKISGHWNEAITAQRRMLNLKYGGNGSHNLYNNMVMFLNAPSIIIDPEDRRINAITGAPAGITPITREEAAEMRRDFALDEFRDQLASFLWRRDLTNFDHTRSDWTLPARTRLLTQSTSFNEEAVDELMAKLPGLICPAKKLRDLANQMLDGDRLLKPEAVTKILQQKIVARDRVMSRTGKTVSCVFFADPSTIPNKSAELAKAEKSFMR